MYYLSEKFSLKNQTIYTNELYDNFRSMILNINTKHNVLFELSDIQHANGLSYQIYRTPETILKYNIKNKLSLAFIIKINKKNGNFLVFNSINDIEEEFNKIEDIKELILNNNTIIFDEVKEIFVLKYPKSYKMLSKTISNNFVNELIKITPKALKYIYYLNPKKITKELCTNACKYHPSALYFINYYNLEYDIIGWNITHYFIINKDGTIPDCDDFEYSNISSDDLDINMIYYHDVVTFIKNDTNVINNIDSNPLYICSCEYFDKKYRVISVNTIKQLINDSLIDNINETNLHKVIKFINKQNLKKILSNENCIS